MEDMPSGLLGLYRTDFDFGPLNCHNVSTNQVDTPLQERIDNVMLDLNDPMVSTAIQLVTAMPLMSVNCYEQDCNVLYFEVTRGSHNDDTKDDPRDWVDMAIRPHDKTFQTFGPIKMKNLVDKYMKAFDWTLTS